MLPKRLGGIASGGQHTGGTCKRLTFSWGAHLWRTRRSQSEITACAGVVWLLAAPVGHGLAGGLCQHSARALLHTVGARLDVPDPCSRSFLEKEMRGQRSICWCCRCCLSPIGEQWAHPTAQSCLLSLDHTLTRRTRPPACAKRGMQADNPR